MLSQMLNPLACVLRLFGQVPHAGLAELAAHINNTSRGVVVNCLPPLRQRPDRGAVALHRLHLLRHTRIELITASDMQVTNKDSTQYSEEPVSDSHPKLCAQHVADARGSELNVLAHNTDTASVVRCFSLGFHLAGRVRRLRRQPRPKQRPVSPAVTRRQNGLCPADKWLVRYRYSRNPLSISRFRNPSR